MTKPPLTIGPDDSLADAARLMHGRQVKRLPVVDDAGELVGIVSRVDVLSVFDRPDAEIRDAVTEKVIAGGFAHDPSAFDVTVRSGIVTIAGQVANHAVAIRLIDMLRHAEGVVGVRDRLDFTRAAQAEGAVLPRHRPSR